jgi:hypothetical protein
MKHISELTRNLEALIVADDPKGREEAARFLGNLAVQCIHQLNSEEPTLRKVAWRQWRRFRASNAVDALLDACEDDPAQEVREAAQFAIDTIICMSGTKQEAQR